MLKEVFNTAAGSDVRASRCRRAASDAIQAGISARNAIVTAMTGAMATCCSFVPPSGPSFMSGEPVIDDQHTHAPLRYRPVTYRRHIENLIRAGNTTRSWLEG
jgi:hypothetical protein